MIKTSLKWLWRGLVDLSTISHGCTELPFYREHCMYMDQFFATGQLLAGGPFLDNQGALGLLAGEDEAQARDIVAHDPFVQAGVVEPHLHPWQDAYFNQYQARRTQSGS